MDNVSRVKHYSSRDAYLNNKPSVSVSENSLPSTSAKTAKPPNTLKTDEAHKVDLSKKAGESLKKVDSKEIKETIKEDVKEVKGAGRHLLGDALGTIAKNIPNPLKSVVPLPRVNIGSSDKASEIPVRDISKQINKPAIFFISGLDLVSSSGGDGLKDMAEAISGAEHFSWKQESEVLEEVLRRPKEQPVVLVGHSLGGDAVVNIANKLNSIEHGFRKVDLLTTLDSVGFDNDIIPSNVKKNLNFINDQDYFFNDGPNIARDSKKTEVLNVLKSNTHRNIDDQSDIQSEIISHVDEVIGSFKFKNRMQKMKDLYSSLSHYNSDK